MRPRAVRFVQALVCFRINHPPTHPPTHLPVLTRKHLTASLVADGVIKPAADVDVPPIPMDLEAAMKAGKVGALDS